MNSALSVVHISVLYVGMGLIMLMYSTRAHDARLIVRTNSPSDGSHLGRNPPCSELREGWKRTSTFVDLQSSLLIEACTLSTTSYHVHDLLPSHPFPSLHYAHHLLLNHRARQPSIHTTVSSSSEENSAQPYPTNMNERRSPPSSTSIQHVTQQIL